MCPRGHSVWRWCSQPVFKDVILVGDFMLATNILISGNTYAKTALLFEFMNMGIIERSSFYRIQDSFCVDSIREFWNEKRAEVISQLRTKGSVVVLGELEITHKIMDKGIQSISVLGLHRRCPNG